jgi:probable 2-oxoglutarate dehydrogenase E1 component DHKTD1
LIKIGHASVQLPASGFQLHKTLDKTFVDYRKKRLEQLAANPSEKLLDWAFAEALAVGSLLRDENPTRVRICGQDVGRGTFSHRHFELVCQESGKKVVPLADNVAKVAGSSLEVVNSFLSELAVVSYEYGYSIDTPNTLCIWEAQFGDFFNQAQVAFDTFISSSLEKWQRPTAMTILLPHGFDGAGPEHSSSRIERFLQMASETAFRDFGAKADVPNWRIINPTTPANYFHALRRQIQSPLRIPLVVISPKILLRLPACQSSLLELAQGTSFQPVLCEDDAVAAQATRVLWCSGKTYYELSAEREKRGAKHVAIVRIEELVPFPGIAARAALAKHPNASVHIWCQEEPENAGAWSHVYPRLYSSIGKQILFAGRPPSAAPAAGYADLHKQEQAEYFAACFE